MICKILITTPTCHAGFLSVCYIESPQPGKFAMNQRVLHKFAVAMITATVLLFSQLSVAADVVNINRADAATMIENLKGIGEVKARAIVSYRKKNGNFNSIEDLLNVKGIGEGLIKKNRRYMSISKGLTKPSGKAATSSSKSKSSTSKSSSTASKSKSSSDSKSKSSKSSKKSSSKSTSSSSKSSKKKSSGKSTKCTSKSTDKKCKSKKKKKKKNPTT